jgi:hypothetical protein
VNPKFSLIRGMAFGERGLIRREATVFVVGFFYVKYY